MRVLVTGGAGFIGMHVVEGLLLDGHDVVVIDSVDPATHSSVTDLAAGASYLWRDLQDPDACAVAVKGVDAVCHLAARGGTDSSFGDIRSFVGQNDVATATLLWALHHRGFEGRFVLGSSMEIYGEGGYLCAEHGKVRPGARPIERLEHGLFEPVCPVCAGPLSPIALDEDARLEPRTVAGSTKLHQEHLCRAFAREHPGAAVGALRYHNVYGARPNGECAADGVASAFLRQIERAERPQVFEDGGQRRDFIHVSDAARATVLTLTAPEPVDGPLNIATGRPATLLELATALCVARNSLLWPEVVGRFRPTDVRHVTGDPHRAATRLGFRAEIHLAEGIAALVRAHA